ncbi:uncharacterized protein H6S33_008047 [Morchella sextelata]|uniref:uncharacterized protein n=1 Tax=Morchella sextelata TaxID=1174677 RepID=UPI001D05172E|nr:uncharacterized protein H6S33_008047 [Morchella sextelata]KAH0603043.1 hypothetical protein H6S33_008047 [Morchella sextelata]
MPHSSSAISQSFTALDSITTLSTPALHRAIPQPPKSPASGFLTPANTYFGAFK